MSLVVSQSKNLHCTNLFILIIVFSIFPAAGLLLGLVLLSRNQTRKASLCIISLFAFAYGWTFIPEKGFDIVRHQELFVEIASIHQFSDFLEYERMSLSPDTAVDYIYWFISRFYKNPQVIGALSSLIYYTLIVLIIDSFFDNFIPTRKRNVFNFILVYFVFIALTVNWYFSGMRNGNAILLFLFLIIKYDYTNLTIKKTVSLFVPGFIHFSMFPVTLLFLACRIFSTRVNTTISLILTLSFPLMGKLFSYIYIYLPKLLGTSSRFILAKIESYFIVGKDISLYTGAGFRFYLVLLPILFLLPVIWIICNSMQCKFTKKELLLHKFVILFFSYTVFFINSFAFSRNHMFYGYMFSLYFFFFLWSDKFGFKSFKKVVLSFMVYISISIIPSWIMGKEYSCIHPNLITKNIVAILRTSVTPKDFR